MQVLQALIDDSDFLSRCMFLLFFLYVNRCAPESIIGNRFTKASDVWSYAVLLWEMYSGGKRPYISAVRTKARGE